MANHQTASDVVAGNVRQLRAGRMTASQLAARCKELGAPGLTAHALYKLEGQRNAADRRPRPVTVDELLVLALALDVPPLALLLPEHDMAIACEQVVDPMRFMLWVNGLYPASGQLPKVRFTRSAAPIALYRAAHDAIETAKNADRACRAARGSEGEEAAAAVREAALLRLADTIRPVLLDGFVPSGLPGGWLDYMADRGWLDPGIVAAAQQDGA